MSGCYGGSFEDRCFENKLLEELDEQEEMICLICKKNAEECECEEHQLYSLS